MVATREGLEAVVREQLTRVVANALMTGVPSTGMCNRAVETILNAADEYTSAEVGLLTPAERRQVLGQPDLMKVDYTDKAALYPMAHECPVCGQCPILHNNGDHCPNCGWAR